MDAQTFGQELWTLRGSVGDAAALGQRLRGLFDEGRAAWPTLALDPARFVAAVARGLPADREIAAGLDGLRAADLYLAAACADGLPEALAAFDVAVMSRVPVFLAGMRASEEMVESTRQALREKLFLGTERTPPKITQYSGRGSLEGWVRVAAVRTALNLLSGRPPPVSEDATMVENALPAGTNVELDYLKSRHRVDVAAAFREALAELDPQDRTLLRFRYVDGLLPAQIAAVYDVHRTTILRRLDAAVATLLAGLRRHVSARLHLGKRETDSLLQLVRSQLEVTLGGLIGGDGG